METVFLSFIPLIKFSHRERWPISVVGAEFKVKFRNLNLDEKKKSKTKLLGEICSFLDSVPPFRDLATKCMGSMIEKQKSQLYELGK